MDELICRQDVMDVVKNVNMSELEKQEALSELPVITPDGFRLKPCPFCGGEAAFIPKSNNSSNSGFGCDFKIECQDCGLSSPKIYKVEFRLTKGGFLNPYLDERKQAASMWNRRADPPEDSNKQVSP